MRQFYLLAFTVLLLGSASALTVKAPVQLPESTNWGASAELSPTNEFTEARILIDGRHVITVFPSGEASVQTGKVLGAFTIDQEPASNAGLEVFFQFFGLGKGSHSVKVEEYLQGEKRAEQEKSIEFVSLLSESSLEEVERRVGVAEEEALISRKNISERVDSAFSSLEGIKSRVAGIEASAGAEKTGVMNALGEIRQSISEIEKDLLAVDSEVVSIKSKVQERAQQSYPFLESEEVGESTGFKVLGSGSSNKSPTGLMPLPLQTRAAITFTAGLALIVIALYRVREQGSGFFRGRGLYSEGFEGLGEGEGKKWSFKGEEGFEEREAKKPKSRKIYVKDLLRRK